MDVRERRSIILFLSAFFLVTLGFWLLYVSTHFFESKPLRVIGRAGIIAMLLLDGIVVGFIWRRRKIIRLQLATAAAWILIGAVASNSMLGVLYERKNNLWNVFGHHPVLGWYPKKSLTNHPAPSRVGKYNVTTDALGHRNALPYPADNVLPYMVQGDSNCFGYGLDNDEILTAHLNRLSGQPLFYNFGVSGFDVNQFYFQYEQWKTKFKPQHRVIYYNLGNDFTMAALRAPYHVRRPYLALEDGNVVEVMSNRNPLILQAYAENFIYTLSAYNHMVEDSRYAWGEVYPEWMLRQPLGRYLAESYHPTLSKWHRSFNKRFGTPPPKRVDVAYARWLLLKEECWPEPFRKYEATFEAILKKMRAQSADLTLLAFPMPSQVLAQKQGEVKGWIRKQGYTDGQIDVLAMNAYMKRVCEQNDIRFIDPTPLFQKHPDPKSLFIKNNEHLTSAGHELCARALLEALSIKIETNGAAGEALRDE